ncbi:MAG: mechanosensitive ion channel family protein [Flavobacteriales bacterium]|nr:mechanosensitive ion channel family protein [Flavobacteriales bacterium]
MHASLIDFQRVLQLLQQKLLIWTEELIRMLPNLVLAALVVVAFGLLARLARRLINKLVRRFIPGNTLQRLVANGVHTMLVLVGLFMALSILHLDKTVTSILAGAGILGLALGFAFQDIASNFIAGVLLAAQRPMHVGDLVQTSGQFGTVERIDLRTTELRDLQGRQVIIPNKEVFQSVLVNLTRYGIRRVDLPVGVSYAEDLDHVKEITTNAIRTVPDVLLDNDIDIFYQSFGDSAVQLEARFWITSVSNRHFHIVRSNAIMAVRKAYREAGITIPFPIRTLDFGIKGGEKLDAMLSGPMKGGTGVD